MYVPAGDPDYYGRTEAVTAADGSVYDAYIAHGTPLWSEGRNLNLLTIDGYICRPVGGYMKNPKRRYVPEISTSLDAVAALAERVLPGWHTATFRHAGSDTHVAEFYIPSMWSPFPEVTVKGRAPTECAARLAAILRAKAKDQTND